MHHEATRFANFLAGLGVVRGQHLVVHASLRRLRSAFSGLSAQDVIEVLQDRVGPRGSLVMPAFTYCFKRLDGKHDIFDPASSPSKVGALSEAFRTMPHVVRTRSATHSFCLWGEAARAIGEENAPCSPLGEGSVLGWLAEQEQACALLLGVDFSALSFCHYLEVQAPVPWVEVFPWHYMGVLPIGVSTSGEQPLRQVPGCSKSFVAFEKHFLRRNKVRRAVAESFWAHCLDLSLLYEQGLYFFRKYPQRLLCPTETCPACDVRRSLFLQGETSFSTGER